MLMNLGDLNSLIDTEAVPSVLDQHIAHKLHLTGSTEKLSVFTHKVDTEQAVVLKVQVGPLRAEALPVVVRDLSFAEDASGTRVDAMIGFDFLSQGPFTIDYKFRKIVFGSIDSAVMTIPYESRPDTRWSNRRFNNRVFHSLWTPAPVIRSCSQVLHATARIQSRTWYPSLVQHGR
jgi:Aspartyl protease